MSMRPISIDGYYRPAGETNSGSAPILQWIKIDDLVVDETYQRPIIGKGRTNIRDIAATFTWAFFAPVIVSPIEGGKYAIVDGQHRTTGAKLAGIESVPCQIIIATRAQQAAAFRAINAATTKVTSLSLYAASLAAGDPATLILADVCRRADVTLLKYPVQRDYQKPGETMAIAAVARCLAQYGRDTLITALQCITATENNLPGVLTPSAIGALCEVLDANKAWRDSGEVLLKAFDDIDIATLDDEAMVAAASQRKTSRRGALVERLTKALAANRNLQAGTEPARGAA